MDNALLFDARARVLADLEARNHASAAAVSALEDAVAQRKWWAEQWPQGEQYVAGLVAQDVQDALEELSSYGTRLDPAWFAPHLEFRFPRLGGVAVHGATLELRHAL